VVGELPSPHRRLPSPLPCPVRRQEESGSTDGDASREPFPLSALH